MYFDYEKAAYVTLLCIFFYPVTASVTRISVVQRAGGGMLDLKRTASNKWR